MIPYLSEIFRSNPAFSKFPNDPATTLGKFGNIGAVIGGLLAIAIYISAALAFFWLVWGAFQYIFAGGNKEELGKARARMTWAVIGLILVLLAYLVTQFAAHILQIPGTAPLAPL